MPLAKVIVNIKNGGLGKTVQTEDGVAGLLIQGLATASLPVLTPKLITTLQGVVDLGLDADYDSDNTVNVYADLKEFYDEANQGAKLYIMLVPQAVDVETMLDKSELNYAVKLLNFAQGKIRLLGVLRNPAVGYLPDVATNNIDIDIINALTTGHALAEEYHSKFRPFRVILPAHAYAGDVGALVDLKTFDKNRCAIVLGGTGSGKNAVALLLGRLASIPVEENIGRVKTGSLSITEVFIGAEEYIDAQTDVEVIHDKGFISLQQHDGKAGYYFTDDPTATAATDDYSSIANGRVIDKATFISNQVFINEIKDKVAIDPATGRIQAVQAKHYETLIKNQINTIMTADQEISGVTVFVDHEQDVIASGRIEVDLRLISVGYAKTIIVNLGFNNPVNN